MRAALLGWIVVLSSTAYADIDMDRADAVFAEGQKLKDAGKQTEACEKFRESLAINPNAVGTMLNVAICDQAAGKIGSALRLFKDARDRGTEQRLGEHVKLAEQHIGEIEADVPYLAIVIAEPSDDTKVVVNNTVVAVQADGSASLPVDPGTVSVIISRPGRVPFEKTLTIERKEHPVLSVPRLRMPVTINKGRKRIGQALVIGGAGLFVIGSAVGLYAVHDYNSLIDNPAYCNKATHQCNNDPPKNAYDATNRDVTLGWVGTGVGATGVLVAGFGTYLWLFGPKDEKLAFAPRLDAREAGIVAFGRF